MLLTKRLRLRQWRDKDISTFAEHNADPQVMQHFPATMTTEQTKASVEKYQQSFAEHGLCFFAAERLDTGEFIGVIGLGISTWEPPFGQFIEVGWRLTPNAWGHGFATEGGLASLAFAFSLGYEEVLSFTTLRNKPSEAVMKRIGMQRNPNEDFDHPKVADGHPLKRHLLYRINSQQYYEQTVDTSHFTQE